MNKIKEVYDPIRITALVIAMKKAGLSDKRIIKAIIATQKQVVKKEIIIRIQTIARELINDLQKT